MIRKIATWLRSLFRERGRYFYKEVDHEPTVLKNNFIYAETHMNTPWRLLMQCPCGCGSKIYLNLNSDYTPFWKTKHHKAKITITPSVHRTTGCRSHFFVTNSQIQWCKQSAARYTSK